MGIARDVVRPVSVSAVVQLELRKTFRQRRDFGRQCVAGGIGFFDHGGILLRCLVHLVHRGIDLLKARRLLPRGLDDRVDILVDLLHLTDDGR